VTAVYDAEELIGLLPVYYVPGRLGVRHYRFLAAPTSLRCEPLALAGREIEVAAALGRAMAEQEDPPDILALEGVPSASAWTGLLATASADRPAWMNTDLRMGAPWIDLSGSGYEAWFAAKSKNFREQTRRRRRKLDNEGAVFRRSDDRTVARDVDALARLHHSRWSSKGGSNVMSPAVERMLVAAAPGLMPDDRFRLWCIDLDGRTISAHLFLVAGGTATYWLGGFDDEWSAQQPAMQVLVAAVEEAFARGDTRLDLGGGAQTYKYRLASAEEELVWSFVVPRERRYLLARLSLAPRQTRRAVLSRLPDDVKNRVKRMLGRPEAKGRG
jgi:CelD/BcsL family acetyltransferase involved in cellulose biosynthesis